MKFCSLLVSCSLALAPLQFTACVYHTIPTQLGKAALPTESVIDIHADRLGDLYPKTDDAGYKTEDGSKISKEARRNIAFSFYRGMTLQGTLGSNYNPVETQKARTEELKRWAQAYEEIVILVHGFNNSNIEAAKAYDSAIDIIRSEALPRKVGFVRFYWDGLNSKPSWLGLASTYWDNAQINSLLVGEKGLRAIITAIGGGKRTLVVTHSRGAAVCLAALSEPSYMHMDEESQVLVKQQTDGLDKFKTRTVPTIPENSSKLTGMFIAPAIGTYAFMKHTNDPTKTSGHPDKLDSSDFLDFHGSTIILGPNEYDTVLKKIIGASGRYGSTWVGSKPCVAKKIVEKLKETKTCKADIDDFSKDKHAEKHDFLRYVKSPIFTKMVRQYFAKKEG